jgi:hypothetical protein
LGNCGSILSWPIKFEKVAQSLTIKVVNCSPGTALKVWPTAALDDVLC